MTKQNKQTWDTKLYNTTSSFVTTYGEDIVKLLDPQKHECILDLGCGTGRLTDLISQQSKQVIGVDTAANMIQTAKESYPNIDFKVCDAQDTIQVEDSSCDSVFSNAALHWMIDADSVVKNVYKALKTNGRFVFEMGGKGNISNLLDSIYKVSNNYGITDYQLRNFYPSISEYATILENNGFTVSYAQIIERPTHLEGDNGVKDWVESFRVNILLDLGDKKDSFLSDIQDVAQDKLLKDGKWYADYVRLRMVAYKN